jgi:hypothetical protein
MINETPCQNNENLALSHCVESVVKFVEFAHWSVIFRLMVVKKIVLFFARASRAAKNKAKRTRKQRQ